MSITSRPKAKQIALTHHFVLVVAIPIEVFPQFLLCDLEYAFDGLVAHRPKYRDILAITQLSMSDY
jgi:hypothetical protein